MLGNSLLCETFFSNQSATSAVLKCCTGSDFITPQEFTSQRTLQALDTTTSTLHLNNLFLSLCRRHSLFIKSWEGENCRTAISRAFSCFPLPSLKRKADVESIFLPLNPPHGRIRWGELKEGNKKPKPLCVCVCVRYHILVWARFSTGIWVENFGSALHLIGKWKTTYLVGGRGWHLGGGVRQPHV